MDKLGVLIAVCVIGTPEWNIEQLESGKEICEMIRGFSPLFKGESEQIKLSTLNKILTQCKVNGSNLEHPLKPDVMTHDTSLAHIIMSKICVTSFIL